MIKCPICSSQNTSVFWNKVWFSDNQVVRNCLSCEVLFLYPQRTLENQRQFDAQYARYISEREKLVIDKLPLPFDEVVSESIAERFEDLKSYFEHGTSFLEVGAEKGGFLQLVRPRFKSITGVDSCPEYKEIIRGLGFNSYSYVEEIPENAKFDRICFFSLLEHIIDPLNFLKSLSSKLNTDGLMIFEVPSAREPLISLYNVEAFKDFYFQAMHPYVYSLDALKILAEKAGLNIIEFKFKQRYNLSNHLQWLAHGVPGGNAKFDKVFSADLQSLYKSELVKSAFTDTLYVIAEAVQALPMK